MKKNYIFIAISLFCLASCGNNESQMKSDVRRLVEKVEKCYAVVNNDMEEDDYDFFMSCNDELTALSDSLKTKYSSKSENDQFNKLFIEEAKKREINNDFVDMWEELFEMNQQ